MPSQVDYPNGIGQFDESGLWGSAADKLSAVATNDGDTSVIYFATGGRQVVQNYTFAALLGVSDPVTSASITAIVREYNHGAGHAFWLVFGAATHADALSATDQAGSVHGSGGSYTTIAHNAAGGQLALSIVNSQHGLDMIGAGGTGNKAEFWVTQFYRTITYGFGAAPAAGDFTQMTASLVAAVIGSGLSLREMPALSAYMKKTIRKWFLPEEYEQAWRDIRAYKHPVSV